MSKHILDLIQQGEHQELDFKFQVNDAKKIARSVSAFANANGGRLLIGVKDNGRISGIRSEEEYYMMETAASLFCKPSVEFEAIHHKIEGKQVLEVVILPQENRPILAPDPDGHYKAYVRSDDENVVADDILLSVWKMERDKKGAFIRYSEAEKQILDAISESPGVFLEELKSQVDLKYSVLRKVLINFVLTEIIELTVHPDGSRFWVNETSFKEEYDTNFNRNNTK